MEALKPLVEAAAESPRKSQERYWFRNRVSDSWTPAAQGELKTRDMALKIADAATDEEIIPGESTIPGESKETFPRSSLGTKKTLERPRM